MIILEVFEQISTNKQKGSVTITFFKGCQQMKKKRYFKGLLKQMIL